MFLSIIIPVYNTKTEYIKECLDSLKLIDSLTYAFETIIVDDGSKDKKTLSYLKSINTDFKIIHKPNGGVGSARNVGVKEATGKYIFYLDSDDKLFPSFNLFLKKLTKDSSIDVLYGNLKTFDADNYEVIYNKFNHLTLYFDENVIPNGSFFKKEAWIAIDGNDETLKTLEDYDFWIRIALKGFKIEHYNEFTYLYRKVYNGESLIQRTANIIDKYEKIIKAKNPISKKYFDTSFIKSFSLTTKKNIFKIIKHYYSDKSNTLNPSVFTFFNDNFAEEFKHLAAINPEETNLYLHSKFRKKKRTLVGLSIHLYFPKLYKTLIKLGAFSYKYNFI